MYTKIPSILAISFFSSSLFATTSHDFGHSAGVKDAGFIVKKDETRPLSDEEIKNHSSNGVTVKATAYNSSDRVGAFIKVNGAHQYCIENYGKSSVEAGFKFTLTTLGQETHSAQTFELPSFHSRCIEETSFMLVYPQKPGNFPIIAISSGQQGDSMREDRSTAVLSVK